MISFEEVNKYCKKRQVVFVGSSYFNNLEVNKENLTNNLQKLIYNRSAERLNIESALDFLKNQVFPLEPSEIFVNIGDEDLKSAGFDLQHFIDNYEWMLLNIHRSCKDCIIYITSVVSVSPAVKQVNKKLFELAKDTGCTFVDFTGVKKDRDSYKKILNIIKQYLQPSSFERNGTMQVSC